MFELQTDTQTSDLIVPEGQSPGADVQHRVWPKTRQYHGLVRFRRCQLRPHNVQLSRERGGAGRADGRGPAELTGAVLITECVRACCDPGEAVQLGPTLREVAQECVVAERHGRGNGK